MAPRVKHQLDVWVQYHRDADHGVLSYGYHYSQPHELREQRIDLKLSELPRDLKSDMNALINALLSRVPTPAVVRLPHAEVRPKITLGYFTLAIQDQRRTNELPACRLYYHEVIPELASNIEREVRVPRPEMSNAELHLAKRAAARLRKMAWEHYESRFGKYFRDRSGADPQ